MRSPAWWSKPSLFLPKTCGELGHPLPYLRRDEGGLVRVEGRTPGLGVRAQRGVGVGDDRRALLLEFLGLETAVGGPEVGELPYQGERLPLQPGRDPLLEEVGVPLFTPSEVVAHLRDQLLVLRLGVER